MKKLFTLLTKTLLVAVCLLGGASSAWAESITVTWLPNNMSSKTTSGTASADGILTVSDFTTSSPITHGDNLSYDSKKWGNFTSTTRPSKNKIAPADYITFTVTVKEGYIFTPTSATAYWVGIGTGNNAAGLYTAIQGSEVSSAADNSSSAASTTQKSLALSGSYKSGQSVTFYIHIGQNNTTSNKGVAIRDVVLTGTYTLASTDPAPASITTQPSDIGANVGVEATLSVEAAGYPAPEYQWYSCDDAEKTNAAPIGGATSASYSFTPAATGTLYFYVTVNNENNISPVESNVVTVTVTAAKAEAPTFTVYGNTVQLASATGGATIYYALDDPDVKTSGSKVEYTGAFIPASSGTVYAYAEKAGFTASDVASKAVTLSTVGDVVGGLLATVQPASSSDNTTTFNDITISGSSLKADGRGVYVNHFKCSGTITLTAANGKAIQSIKIYGTSNDGSKVATITAGSGATVVSSPAELMPRDVTVGGVQTMTEIVITVDEPAANNSVSFTLGRESRLYVEAYGGVPVEVTSAGYATYVPSYDLDFSATTLKAYTVEVASKGKATLHAINKVPANTPVLLIGATENVPVAASTDAVPTNDLLAGEDAAVATIDGDYTNMILNNIGGNIGFYFANDQTVATNRAYLHFASTLAPDEVGAPMQIIFDDEITGVETLNVERRTTNDNSYYDLQGRRVAQPKKGLYIVNGRKVIIK